MNSFIYFICFFYLNEMPGWKCLDTKGEILYHSALNIRENEILKEILFDYFPNTQEMYFIGRLSKRIIVFIGIKRGKRIIIEENWPKYPNYHSRIMLSPDDLFCIYSLKTTVLIKIQVHWASIFAFLPKCHHFCY